MKKALQRSKLIKMTYRYQVQEDVILRLCMPEDFIQNASQFKLVDTDTVLVGYPRSGMTWLSYILFLLRRGGQQIDFTERLWEEIPEIGIGRRVTSSFGNYFVQQAEMIQHPRILRTHLPCEAAPVQPNAKYIYISRNPLDVAVSLYHDIMAVNEFDGRFDDFFDYFIHAQTDYNCYFKHHLGWHKLLENHVVLWITYEELTTFPKDVIKRIGNYMGGDYQEAANDPIVMSEILHNCSFTAMKDHENMLTKKTRDGHSLFRRGIIGDFKNFFTEEQIAQVREEFRRNFKGTLLENVWAKYKLPL